MEINKGDIIGSWIIGEYLGSGAFSNVYCAKNASDDRQEYAIKICKIMPEKIKKNRKNIVMVSESAQQLYSENNLYKIRLGVFPGMILYII